MAPACSATKQRWTSTSFYRSSAIHMPRGGGKADSSSSLRSYSACAASESASNAPKSSVSRRCRGFPTVKSIGGSTFCLRGRAPTVWSSCHGWVKDPRDAASRRVVGLLPSPAQRCMHVRRRQQPKVRPNPRAYRKPRELVREQGAHVGARSPRAIAQRADHSLILIVLAGVAGYRTHEALSNAGPSRSVRWRTESAGLCA